MLLSMIVHWDTLSTIVDTFVIHRWKDVVNGQHHLNLMATSHIKKEEEILYSYSVEGFPWYKDVGT